MKRDTLYRVARRAESRPSFVAHALAFWRWCRGWTDDDMAEWLGCTRDDMARLALCRRPVDEGDLARIAERFGADLPRLAEVLAALKTGEIEWTGPGEYWLEPLAIHYGAAWGGTGISLGHCETEAELRRAVAEVLIEMGELVDIWQRGIRAAKDA